MRGEIFRAVHSDPRPTCKMGYRVRVIRLYYFIPKNPTTCIGIRSNLQANGLLQNLMVEMHNHFKNLMIHKGKVKGKSVTLQAFSGPEGSRKLRFPDYMTAAQDSDKFVSLTHRPPIPPRKCSWYSFLLEAESTPGS